MPADQALRLTQLARARHDQTMQRAQAALNTLAHNRDPITIARLASTAGVSRSWIYTQPDLRDQIEQHQHNHTRTSPAPRTTDTHASTNSLRRRLDLAHQRITQLHAENQQLRAEAANP